MLLTSHRFKDDAKAAAIDEASLRTAFAAALM